MLCCFVALACASCGDDSQPAAGGGQGGTAGTNADASSLAGSGPSPDGALAEVGSNVGADGPSDAGDARTEGGSGGCRPMPEAGAANDGNTGADANATFAMAMPLPAVIAPSSSNTTTDRYQLTIRTGTVTMRPGNPTPIVGFNGSFPGPTIIATKGKAVEVTQTNAWTEKITIHNHGHKVAASSDGHPVDYVDPGKSKTYFYPNDQRAGTYWYHDHAMDLTGPHVYKGLVGFYIIHDPAEDALKLPSGNYDVPILLQDKLLKADNALDYPPTVGLQGLIGDRAIVNGVETPHFDVATRRYRFRVLNGSNARIFQIGLRSGKSFQVIASDGGLLAAPVTLKTLSVAPAERYDIVVDFSDDALGSTDVLTNSNTTFAPPLENLLQFRVNTPACDDAVVPATLSTITRLAEADSTGSITLQLAQQNLEWMINGLTYDPARLDVTSKNGDVRIWRLANQSGVVHPFHKHLVQFNILDIDGIAPPPEQTGWKDTVQVPDGSTVRIIFRNQTVAETGDPVAKPQTFVFHCHILEHEDHRMMLQESVTP